MLALRSKVATHLMAGAMVFSAAWNVSSATGQIPPSQRYRPAQNVAPPSVHVPPQQMRSLRDAPNASYRLSDESLQSTLDRPAYERGVIQQTSYQSVGEPAVPKILQNANENTSAPVAASTPAAPEVVQGMPQVLNDPIGKVDTRKSPQDFAASMSQVRSGSPRIAPEELNSEKAMIEKQMAELRVRAQQRQLQSESASKTKVADLARRLPDSQANSTPQQQVETDRGNGLRGSQVADNQFTQTPAMSTPADSDVSASEFVRRISARTVPATTAAPAQDSYTQASTPSISQVTTSDISQTKTQAETRQPEPRNIATSEIRQVSSESYVDEKSNASIRLDAPALSVETFGPQTVGVNKPAVYQVKVHNSSHSDAERILVGVKLPAWVDIDNINLTSGGKEITDGQDRARVVWNIDRIPAKGSQTITITAIPRKAEMFDVGVEWTLVPREGKANVTVTEPRLEMNISGPKEVQFGEKALYHVTVRNPGTGTAENVAVMLPEALGGERASLGNIEPGKEKNFQVELLARTAGNLSLVATANAEGNLKVSADRKLIVRRANLGIALQGPAMKYAGSISSYNITLTNTGDAPANEVVTAVALPAGVKYLGGIDSVKVIEGGLRWPVGSLDPGQTRTYKIDVELNASGDLQLEVGARGKGDLAASSACLTTVETIADLVLTVADPKGPLPTGEKIMYEINIRNRGSRAAKGVNLVMQFSEGIEPHDAQGQEHRIVPGQVLFSPINQIDPGQDVSYKVNAEAFRSGTHVFRAQLTCDDSESREIAEGTTRFFGDDMQQQTANADAEFESEGSNDFTR